MPESDAGVVTALPKTIPKPKKIRKKLDMSALDKLEQKAADVVVVDSISKIVPERVLCS